MPIRPLLAALLLLASPALADTTPEPPYPPQRDIHPDSAYHLALLDEASPLLKPIADGVIVTDHAEEPRHTLRYQPRTGATQRFSIRSHVKIHTGMQAKIGDDISGAPLRTIDLPIVILECTATVTAGFPDSFELTITVDAVRAEGFRVELPPHIVDKATAIYADSTATIIADNRGNIIHLKIDSPFDGDTVGLATLEEIVRRLIIPLPEELVGLNATWHAPRKAPSRILKTDIDATVRDRYILTAHSEHNFKVQMYSSHDIITDIEPNNAPPGEWTMTHRALRSSNLGAGVVNTDPNSPPVAFDERGSPAVRTHGILDTFSHPQAPGRLQGRRTDQEVILLVTPIKDPPADTDE